MVVKAYLFGPMRITQDGKPLALPASVPARSLLAYLLLHKETPHSRLVLAGNLWPETEEAHARRRLSQALWSLRDALPGLIESDRQIIGVNATDVWIDANAFQEMSKTEQSLHQAVSLYTGPLLDGFYDDWVITRREQVRENYLIALERLIDLEKAAGRFEDALAYGLRLVEMDPLQESSHRELMRLYMALNRPKSALQQFETCRQILRTELGAEPNPASVQLAEEIARSALLKSPADLPQLETIAPTGDKLSSQTIPLIGRDGERRTLLAHIDRMLDGQGGLILVEGEAGVGKTRLLEEIARDANWRGIQTLWGYGREMEVTPPFGPLVAALESGLTSLRVEQLSQTVEKPWLQVLTALLPTLASHLPELQTPSPVDPNQEQVRLLEALGQFLIAWARITPLVLILENLHWIDRDTLDILPDLVRRISPAGILLIATYRSEEARSYPVLWEKLQAIDRAGLRDRMTLVRLDAPDTGELIRRWLGFRSEVPIFESRLYQETEGNPLFVLETLRALHDEGLLKRDESGQWSTPWDETTADYAELPLPPAVERVIARRLDRLTPDERIVLDTAAILGNQFEFSLLSTLNQRDSEILLDALGNLVRRQFLCETPQAYHFSHDKIRQVAYQSIEESQRPRLHRRAGEALERQHPGRVASLAYHFDRGQVWAKAFHYHREAGEQAIAVSAYTTAREFIRRAVELLERVSKPMSEHFDLLERYEAVLFTLGERTTQRNVLPEMERLAHTLNDTARLSRVLYFQGRLEVVAGKPQHAISILDEAARLSRITGDEKLLGNCLTEVARAWWRVGDFSRCQAAVLEAQVLAEATGNIRSQARAWNMLGNLHLGMTGDYSRALACFEEDLRLSRIMQDFYGVASSQGNIGIAATLMGCYPRSQDALAEAWAVMTRVGDRVWQGIIRLWQGENHYALDDWDQALTAAQESLAICREVGDKNFEIEALSLQGQIALSRGDASTARRHFEQSAAVAQDNQQINDWCVQCSYLARACLHQGDLEAARRFSKQAVNKLETLEESAKLRKYIYFARYEVLAATDGNAAAASYLEHAYHSLMDMADLIQDEELRQSFLENVSENTRIVEAFQQAQAAFSQQKTCHLPHADAPTGRPLRDDEWIEVVWTVAAPGDDAIPKKATRRRHRLQRLLNEAASQGAAPRLTDLATALGVSQATIKRDLSALRMAGFAARTRGSRIAKNE